VKILRFILLYFIGLSISGCSPVQPWERGTLAKPFMSLNPTPERSLFEGHIYSSREASTGGGSAKGGGCGCN
jgi:Domain of unknown function (DUF4266)